LVQTSFFYL